MVKGCAECSASITACGSFMEGWLSVRHELSCEWAKVFAPLGEHLIFKGSEAAVIAMNTNVAQGHGFNENEKHALVSIALAVATPNDAAADFGNCVNCNRRIYRTGRMWYHQSTGGMSCPT